MSVQMVGFASAPVNSDFGPGAWTDLSVDRPALAPILDWEQDCIEAPALCVRDDQLVVFYAGGYNNAPQQIGVAASTDGCRWDRLSDQPLVAAGEPGSWNSSESGHPGLLTTEDGASHLFSQGNADDGHTWRIAGVPLGWDGIRPFPRPTRPHDRHRSQGNPRIIREGGRNDSGRISSRRSSLPRATQTVLANSAACALRSVARSLG